jgi:hypothetical protein
MEGVPPFACALVYNPDTTGHEIYNFDDTNDKVLVNKRIVKRKEIVTISDWIKVNDIIIDLTHPKFVPLFMPDLKVQFLIDFEDKEEFIVGNTEEASIKFQPSFNHENYALITKSRSNYYCSYPKMTLETHQEFRPIFINELKLNYGDVKLIDRNDAIFIDDVKLDFNLIPGFLELKETYFVTEVFST